MNAFFNAAYGKMLAFASKKVSTMKSSQRQVFSDSTESMASERVAKNLYKSITACYNETAKRCNGGATTKWRQSRKIWYRNDWG